MEYSWDTIGAVEGELRLEDRFSPFQCEVGLTLAEKGFAGFQALVPQYLRDAMFHLTEDEFVEMCKRISKATT